MRRFIFTCLCLAMAGGVLAQDEDKLFGSGDAPPAARSGFILNVNGAMDLPGGDMAKRFGTSYKVGPAVLYKRQNNWLFGAKFDFIVGSQIREDSLMANIRDKYPTSSKQLYEFINTDGQRVGVPVYERGYAVGLQVGKIFATSKHHPDNGWTILTTAGFMQHRINIFDRDKNVLQIKGDLVKGYDRLANGLFVEQYVGYSYFAKNKLVNFTIGLDALVGFTQGRRDWLYDVNRPGTDKRLDMLFGVRAGWFIPIFKRKSADMLFE